MAPALVCTNEALDDIDAIAQFIARDSLQHSRRVVDALFSLGDAIREQPMAGRTVPELGSAAVRERFSCSYRVVYEISTEHIAILAVIHGPRLLESVAERF